MLSYMELLGILLQYKYFENNVLCYVVTVSVQVSWLWHSGTGDTYKYFLLYSRLLGRFRFFLSIVNMGLRSNDVAM